MRNSTQQNTTFCFLVKMEFFFVFFCDPLSMFLVQKQYPHRLSIRSAWEEFGAGIVHVT